MKHQLKPLPQFKDEKDEREFWDKHSSMDYIDWNQAELVTFSNLKPSAETISLRLPTSLLAKIKVVAHKSGIPYQSFMKMKLHEMISEMGF